MKNTKRLLIILCAMALLSAIIFSFAVSAVTPIADDEVELGVIANQGTNISEYFDMKKITHYGFEDADGVNTLVTRVNNGGKGGVWETNSVWKSASPIYSETSSTKFFAIDYTTNKAESPSHYYIQPVLAQPPGTANIEKSPAYGFVAEFDLAFLSAVETVTEQGSHSSFGLAYEDANGILLYTKQIQENGVAVSIYFDENERRAYKDPTGAVVYEDGGALYLPTARGDRQAFIQEDNTALYRSSDGNYYMSDGTMIRDVDESKIKAVTVKECVSVTSSDVQPNMIPVMVPLLDENGNEVKNEEGETVMVEKAEKTGFETFSRNFAIEMLNTGTVNDGSVSVIQFSARDANNIEVIYGGKTVHTITSDEWLHITIQYDADTNLTYVYVGDDDYIYTDESTGKKIQGRKLVAQFNAHDTSRDLKVYPLSFRIGATSKGSVVGVDNFLAYQGKSIHNPDLLANSSVLDQFTYISGLLEDASNTTSAVISYQAYEYIKENLISSFADLETGEVKPIYATNETIVKAVELFNMYKNDTNGAMAALKREINIENRDKYIYYVDIASSAVRAIDNSQDRITKITAAEKFLSSVGSSIERDDIFLKYQRQLEELSEKARLDSNANEFVSYMNLFDQSIKYISDGGAVSINRLKTHYEKAKSYYEMGISDYEEFDFYQTDSNGDYVLDDNGNRVEVAAVKDSYNKLKAAVESYATALSKIESKTTTENGERFVGIVETMKNNSCGNWAEDGPEVENLWKMAFDIIDADNYDETVVGMSDAKAIYNSANEYFYKKMQNEHKAILRERLEGFNTATSYVDKAAICTYVERYIETNEKYIDMNDLELKGLIATTEAYKAQLGTVEEDYSKILVQNTIEFVNTMKYTDKLDSYADLKPLYTKATEFYYAMNFKSDSISDEEIELYVVKYELLRAKIIAIETDCEIFLTNSAKLSTESDKNAVYSALAQCCECLDNLDFTYEGIEEAKAAFDVKYNEYMASAEIINNQIEQTANAVCSLRGNWGFDAIVSYFKSIFN